MNKSYISSLRAEAEAASLRSEEAKAKSHTADSRILCDITFTTQISQLMASISPAQRNRPWSMDEFVTRLSGRYSAKRHAMNVGNALRQLRWSQKRDWSAQGTGRRVWRMGQD